MRVAYDVSMFTPFGMWLREYGRPSNEMCVTNLDYVIEDHVNKKLMLLEEKQSAGTLKTGQRKTFEVMDFMLASGALPKGYEYWGFFCLRFGDKQSMPGPGMTLNGVPITVEQLVDHVNFRRMAVKPFRFAWRNNDEVFSL